MASPPDFIQAHIVPDEYIGTYTCKFDAVLADKLLEINTANKPLSPSTLKTYINEYLRGKWDDTRENIIIGYDYTLHKFELISGQHRSLMIKQITKMANEDPDFFTKYPDCPRSLSFIAEVTCGVDVRHADNVDRGKSRTNADVLFRDRNINILIPEYWKEKPARRKKWTRTLAGAARLVWLRSGGAVVSSAPKFLPSEMLDFIFSNGHVGLAAFVTEVLDMERGDNGNKGLKMSLPYIVALAYVASLDVHGSVIPDRKEKILNFLESVALGTDLEANTPAHAITGYWNMLTSQPGSKDRDRDWVGPFVKTLNALLDDTEITPQKVRLTRKEADEYSKFPLLLPGWDEVMFEEACHAADNTNTG